MTEKKLVQAFKAFIQKSVLPYNQGNDVLLNDWKHFNNIISSDTIDPNQLDFYLYIVGKQNSQIPANSNSPSFNSKIPPERQSTSNISDFNVSKFGKKQTSQYNIGLQKKNSVLTNSTNTKRKTLLNNIQNFQNLLIRNQQKLQNFNRNSFGSNGTPPIVKQTSFTLNGGNKKFY